MKKANSATKLFKPKKKRKGVHSKNNKPSKRYRGQGK